MDKLPNDVRKLFAAAGKADFNILAHRSEEIISAEDDLNKNGDQRKPSLQGLINECLERRLSQIANKVDQLSLNARLSEFKNTFSQSSTTRVHRSDSREGFSAHASTAYYYFRRNSSLCFYHNKYEDMAQK